MSDKLPVYSDYTRDQTISDVFDNLIREEGIAERGIFEYHIHRLYSPCDLFSAALWEIFDARRVIKKCNHCGRFFATPRRADSKYCSRPSRENANLTCAEEEKYEQKLAREKLSRQGQNAYRRALRRMDTNAKTEEERTAFFTEKQKQRTALHEKKITVEQYIEWLDSCWRKGH